MKTSKHNIFSTVRTPLLAGGLALLLASPVWALSDYDMEDEWLDEAIETMELVSVYDQNNDQLLSTTEIQQGVNNDIQRYDNNRDNQLSLNEFEALWIAEVQQYVQQEFNRIDTDNSRDLNSSELIVDYKQIEKRLFASSCLVDDKATEQEYAQEAHYEIAGLDNNRDGKLDYAEFSVTQRSHIIEDFRDIDADGNGQLTQIEYQAALHELATAAVALKRDLPVQC